MAPLGGERRLFEQSEDSSQVEPSRPLNGRATSSHAAEKAATRLRDFARGRPPSERSSSSSVQSFYNGNPFSDRRPPERKQLSPPATSSAAAAHSSSAGSGSSEDSSSKSSDLRSPQRPQLQSLHDSRDDQSRRPPLSVPRGRQQRRLPSGPLQALSPNSGRSGSRKPVTMADLGRDYTRYPFTYPKTPTSYPSTPAPQYSPPAGQTPLKGTPMQSVVQLGLMTDPEKAAPIWLLDDRIGAPYALEGSFPLYTDEKEEDDDMHIPLPEDERKLKPTWKDRCNRRQLANMCGLIFVMIGLLCVFVLLPVLGYTGHAIWRYPYDDPESAAPKLDPDDYVNDVKYPLFKNIRYGLIDPDTPESKMTRKTFDEQEWELVFSDEFNQDNRTFYPGDDPFWTAQDIWYGSTQDLEWYDPDAATTGDGTLKLRLDQFANHGLAYRSGMINSWNQLCMKGGALEIGVSLAGPGGASGLWPGAWTMGNLGRPGYKASTEGLWPYTYDTCDAGITPNQSMTDGTSYLPGQRLPSCTCKGEDHPTPGTGRGAPEIDVFEASADPTLHLGIVTQSYQVAPFDVWYHPDYDYLSIPNYNVTQMNGYCGGPFQQAVSGQTELNNKWYDNIQYQKYGFEYTPGSGEDGHIAWFVGDDVSFEMSGEAVGPNGNVGYRPISEEPMAITLNLGFSTAWTGIHMDELRFPTTMYVDYVRFYQKAGEHMVTCDPPGYETTKSPGGIHELQSHEMGRDRIWLAETQVEYSMFDKIATAKVVPLAASLAFWTMPGETLLS
ncbi:uncharacterized protein KY384_007417 [Bacidia gigantensis]|uniref:uncharacterized protein n=1 Tax=Bacidia gigantensis TaxID=2732470 RepID=UPI001D0479F4|nr:uncharacterized protein KY384_007417 [Bacidia gigantensis]KAG8528499.1 hypothetical protein KY384_007417 [Bacidia gigantensis]